MSAVNPLSPNPLSPELRFAVLGPVRAWRGEHELGLGPRQQRQILALLLIQAGRDVAVHEFVEMLWGPEAPASAINSVHRFLGSLRRVLEPGLPARAEGTLLARRDAAYRLVAPGSTVDLAVFRRLAAEARDAERLGRRDLAIDRYREALDRSHGRCADDTTSESRRYWAFTGVDEEYLLVARDAARAAVAFDRIGPVLPAVRRAAERNPLDETLQARMMLLLAADGRQAEAFALFQRVRELLATSLGIDPGAELRAAYDAILRKPAAVAPPAPTRPAQLPRALPVFAGRRDDLGRAEQLLRAAEGGGAAPIVAIDGMPGVGKSAFALHWAHRLAERYPGGQIYLDLRRPAEAAPMSTDDALHQLLSSLGIPSEAVPLGCGARAALFRSRIAGRRVLVLIDNAESAEQVMPLLPGEPGCLALITGRTRMTTLAVAGAGLLTLDLPSAEDARHLLARRLSVTLGDHSWAAARESVDAIVTACGRLPVALVAACTSLELHPADDLVGFATRLLRHHHGLDGVLREAFARSYDALSPPAARLFRMLSLNTGPDIPLAAAAGLAGLPLPELRSHLGELRRTHLVPPSGSHVGLHPLLHAYARELSDQTDSPAEQNAARARLYQHYRHTAYAAQRLLKALLDPIPPGPLPAGVTVTPLAGYRDAHAWFAAERAMLEAQIAGPGDPSAAVWELASTLMGYYQRAGLWHDLRAVLTTALQAAERSGDRPGQAHMCRQLSGPYVFLGDPDRALDLLRRAMTVFTELGMAIERAYVHFNTGYVLEDQRRYEEAEREYEAARQLFTEAGYEKGAYASSRGLADCLRGAGEYARAAEIYGMLASRYRTAGDHNGVAGCLHGLGEVWRAEGRHDRAAGYYRRAAAVWQSTGNSAHQAVALEDLGSALAHFDTAGAIAAWRGALAIYESARLPGALAVRDRIRRLLNG